MTIYKNAQKIAKENRELPHICKFCVNAHTLYDSDTMLCDRKGIVDCEFFCKKFAYDPFKHIPAQTPPMLSFDESLLSLEPDESTEKIITSANPYLNAAKTENCEDEDNNPNAEISLNKNAESGVALTDDISEQTSSSKECETSRENTDCENSEVSEDADTVNTDKKTDFSEPVENNTKFKADRSSIPNLVFRVH